MKRPSEQETFVRFVQVLREDEDLARAIRTLAKAEPKSRAMFLTIIAAQMRQAVKSEELAQVVERLREPVILKKILQLLDEEP